MAAVFYLDGKWYDEDPKFLGAMNHVTWFGSSVFDGARSFDGLAPDLDPHCNRLINSAKTLGMIPDRTGEEVAELCRQGIRKLPKETVAYIRPMYMPMNADFMPDPETTKFVLAIHEMPFPEKLGFSACLSSMRRPAPDVAPTDAKAGCLYPNAVRAMREAGSKGFANAVMLDPDGKVAEFANANVWIAKDGVARTPVPNGTFLNGLTRQRVMQLLRDDGVEVEEASLTFEDILEADEVFNTGNFAKVMPCTRVEDRELQPGPIYQRARRLYFEYAAETSVF